MIFGWTVLVFMLGFWAGAALNWQTPILRGLTAELKEFVEWKRKAEAALDRITMLFEKYEKEQRP